MTENNKKQTLLAGALTGSFGVFLSKALGLFYVVPLNSFAGERNMAFYSITYTYYDLLLKVCSAGIPFAIAAMVAKYVSREDYKTAALVRRLGTSLIMGLSFVVACVFFLGSGPLARSALGASATPEDIASLLNLFRILLLAIIFVPFLSSLRGFYQGLKRMDIYAVSQVLEQFIRVFCIVAFGFVLVRVLHFDSVYAIYMAILAAGLAAVLTIVYFLLAAKKEGEHFTELVNAQNGEALPPKRILKELISIGLPYVAVSFIGTAGPLVDANFFVPYATRVGIDYDTAMKALGIVQVNCSKIASIPQVLTLGFSAGLVPYLTESLEKQDQHRLRQQLEDIFKTVLYILSPIVLIIAFFAPAIYYIMYGGRSLEQGAHLLSIYSLVALSDTVAPIFSSVLITLRFRRNAIIFLIIAAVVKLLSFFVFVYLFGDLGMIFSTSLCSFVVIALGLILLKRNFNFNVRSLMKVALRSVISAMCAILPVLLLNHFLPLDYTKRLLCLVHFGIEGVVMVLIYVGVSAVLRVPQEVFHMKDFSIKKILGRFRH